MILLEGDGQPSSRECFYLKSPHELSSCTNERNHLHENQNDSKTHMGFGVFGFFSPVPGDIRHVLPDSQLGTGKAVGLWEGALVPNCGNSRVTVGYSTAWARML